MQAKQLLAIGLCVGWLMPGVATAEDFWLKDTDTGCLIWNDEAPVAEDAVNWSGDCTDGKASGSGVLVWMKATKLYGRYDGDMQAGKLHGPGTIIIQTEDGKGYDRMRGQFEDGEAEGRATFVGANGDYYEGQVKGGKMHGEGLFSDAGGNAYEGRFVNGKPDGAGQATTASGEEYHGDFANGERHGSGILIKANGDVYLGQFEKGFAVGAGRLDSDEGTYVGQFKASEPDGPGTFTDTAGTVFQGLFVKGKANGQFLVTAKDGAQETKTYKDGEKVQ